MSYLNSKVICCQVGFLIPFAVYNRTCMLVVPVTEQKDFLVSAVGTVVRYQKLELNANIGPLAGCFAG